MIDGPGCVLLVDDEENIRKGLRGVLAKQGYTLREAASAKEALAELATFTCDTAVVDIRMPGMSGLELMQTIRERWPHISIIILTGQGSLASAMTAVKAGAHDYLLKPASPDTIRQTVAEAITVARYRKERDNLLSTLHASLNRLDSASSDPTNVSQPTARSHKIVNGNLQIDLKAHRVFHKGKAIYLTPSEFNLLVVLASHPGEVVDYITLVEQSLNYHAESWEAKELIKRHIFSLRKKIEPDSTSPQYILNVRGVGYRLASPQTPDTG